MFLVNALLTGIGFLLAADWRVSGRMGDRIQVVRLWGSAVFFWWAYKWSGWTLHAVFPPDFSLDAAFIALEERIGQPSLHWARFGNRAVTELLHFFYATYYLYTALIGIALHRRRRFLDFERFLFAVGFGYAVSYTMFALTPLWGPRWALVEAGLLDPSEQRLQGFLVTGFVNFLQWGGIALKGGALPSSHTSTAVIFAVWCGRLWGWKAAVPAWVCVAGMGVGAVYGRYHYVSDILIGGALGAAGLLLAERVARTPRRENAAPR